jgi:hypothetical protein
MTIPNDVETQCFDAAVSFPFLVEKRKVDAQLYFPEETVAASLSFYPRENDNLNEITFVQVFPHKSLPCKWKDDFMVSLIECKSDRYKGVVLDPLSEKLSPGKMKKRMDY